MCRALRRTPSWRQGVRKLSDMKLTALFVIVVIAVAARGTAGDTIAVQCPDASNGNIVIAHQFECSSFYLCDGSPKPSFLLRCPTGMLFGEEGTMGTGVVGGGCVQEAECRPQVEVNAVPGARESRALPTVDRPGDYRNYTMHLPNPANCSQFYRYEGEAEPQLFECPSGLGFDPVLESCDSKVTCRSTSCPPASPPKCPPNNEELVHLPHPTDCSKFYKCNWGNPVLFDCPANLHFNPSIQVCDWPRNVPCDRCSSGHRTDEVPDGEVPDEEVPDEEVPEGEPTEEESTNGEGRIDARFGRQDGGRASSSSPGGRQTSQGAGQLPGRGGGQSAGYASKGGRTQTTASGVQPNYRGQEDRQAYQPSSQGYQPQSRPYQPTNRQQPGYSAAGQGYQGTNQDFQPGNPSQGYQGPNQDYQPTSQGRQPGNPSQGYQGSNQDYQPNSQGRQPGNPSQGYQGPNQGYQPNSQGRQPGNPSQGYQGPNQDYQPNSQGRQPGSRQQANQGYQPSNREFRPDNAQQPGQEHQRTDDNWGYSSQGRAQPSAGSRSLQGHREYGSNTQIKPTVDGYPLYQPESTVPPRSQQQTSTVPPRSEYQPRPTPPVRRYLTAPQGEQGGSGRSYQPVMTMAPVGRYQPDDQSQSGTRPNGQWQPGSQPQGEPRWVDGERPAPGPRVQMKPTKGIGGQPQYYQPDGPDQSIDTQGRQPYDAQGRQPNNAQNRQWYDSQKHLLTIAQGRQPPAQQPTPRPGQANASSQPPLSREFHSVRVYHSESSTRWPSAGATTPRYGQDAYRPRDPYQPIDQDTEQGPDSGIEQVSYSGGYQDPDEQLYGNSPRPSVANQRGGPAQQHPTTQRPASASSARAHQRPQGNQYVTQTSPQPQVSEDYQAEYDDGTSQPQTRSVGSQMPGPADLRTRPVGSGAARSSELRAEPPRPVYQHVMRIPTPSEAGRKA